MNCSLKSVFNIHIFFFLQLEESHSTFNKLPSVQSQLYLTLGMEYPISSVFFVVEWNTLSGTVLDILCTSWITAWIKTDLLLCLIIKGQTSKLISEGSCEHFNNQNNITNITTVARTSTTSNSLTIFACTFVSNFLIFANQPVCLMVVVGNLTISVLKASTIYVSG